VSRKGIATLHKEWEQAQKNTDQLRKDLDSKYKRRGLKPVEVVTLLSVWMLSDCVSKVDGTRCTITRAIADYPDSIPHDVWVQLTRAPAFPAVVGEMSRCRQEFPASATKAFKKYLSERYCDPDNDAVLPVVLSHVFNMAREAENKDKEIESFFNNYRQMVVKYGYLSMVVKYLVHRHKTENPVGEDVWKRLIDRFSSNKAQRDTHPLVHLASAEGTPAVIIDDIVRKLLSSGDFWAACKLVQKKKRDDLIPLLEGDAERLDLYRLQDFLRMFPKADRERFREIVRKQLTPDPEEIIEAFLSGRDHMSRSEMMHAMYGPAFVCGPIGFGRRRGPWG
jgi:hypothetical protein